MLSSAIYNKVLNKFYDYFHMKHQNFEIKIYIDEQCKNWEFKKIIFWGFLRR